MSYVDEILITERDTYLVCFNSCGNVELHDREDGDYIVVYKEQLKELAYLMLAFAEREFHPIEEED